MTVTYSLTNDEGGNFSLTGSTVKTAKVLASGSHSITVRATDDNGWVKDKTFTIAVSHVASSGDSYMLYVAGQSNSSAEGTLATTNPAGWVSDAGIKIWNNSTWETYTPGVNSMGNNNTGTQYWGPELGFGLKWRLDNPSKTLYIVKHSVGGTGLGPTTDPTWDSTVSASLYSQLKAKSVAAKANLVAASLNPIPFAMSWTQGETPDAGNQTYANGYATKLAALFAAMRADMIGNSAIILCGRIPQHAFNVSAYKETIVAAQIASVAGSQPAAMVDARYESINIRDGYHYPAADVLAIGKRVYFEALGSLGFAEKLDAAVNSTVTSETLTIRNIIGSSLPVTVTGCTWSKNGGAYSSSAGTVTNGDTVTIQAVASATNATATFPAINIGNTSISKRIFTFPALGSGTLDGSESDGTGWYNVGGPQPDANFSSFTFPRWDRSDNASITRNAAIAPDGTLTAIEIRSAININSGQQYPAPTMVRMPEQFTPNTIKDVKGVGFVASIYFKVGENGSDRYQHFSFSNGGPGNGGPGGMLWAFIDTQTWTVSDMARNTAATTSGDSISNVTIQDAKYGFKKITVTGTFTVASAGGAGYFYFGITCGMTPDATAAAAIAASRLSNSGQYSPYTNTGDGLKHFYLWRPKVT